jgi:hypothetical protein
MTFFVVTGLTMCCRKFLFVLKTFNFLAGT